MLEQETGNIKTTSFSNLAEDERCDSTILLELLDAGIKVEVHEQRLKNEVPATLTGALIRGGDRIFKFTRGWYYWIVDGAVPEDVAWELYNNPVGRKDVRVDGDCSCPPPKFPDWYRDGERSVLHYNIDSIEGLKLFADTMRKHGLADK